MAWNSRNRGLFTRRQTGNSVEWRKEGGEGGHRLPGPMTQDSSG